mmetsp:Transcript_13720/g.42906  ORF Transcript_13720/g.42906 Transcript_13720/m.42906 type:complete len:217 (-) Transcript_13720:13-663(-)
MSRSCCCSSCLFIQSANPRMRLASASFWSPPSPLSSSLAEPTCWPIIAANDGFASILRTSATVAGSSIAFSAAARLLGSCIARESAAMPSWAFCAPACAPCAPANCRMACFIGPAIFSISRWNDGSCIIFFASATASGSSMSEAMTFWMLAGSFASCCKPAMPSLAFVTPASGAAGCAPPLAAAGRAKPRGTCAATEDRRSRRHVARTMRAIIGLK